MNIFRNHYQQTLAKLAAEQAAENGDTSMLDNSSNVHDQMLAQLDAHKTQLKAIKSIKAKGVKKREFLGDYLAYVDGVLAADEGVQDNVVMTIFVWAIDAGDFELAIRIADWALSHNLDTPHQFERTVAEVLAEEFSDYVLANMDTIETHLDGLLEIREMVDGHTDNMADQVRAKLYKSIGYAQTNEFPQDALDNLVIAIDLNSRIGVKRDIENLTRRLKSVEDAKQAEIDKKKNLTIMVKNTKKLKTTMQDEGAKLAQAEIAKSDKTQSELTPAPVPAKGVDSPDETPNAGADGELATSDAKEDEQ